MGQSECAQNPFFLVHSFDRQSETENQEKQTKWRNTPPNGCIKIIYMILAVCMAQLSSPVIRCMHVAHAAAKRKRKAKAKAKGKQKQRKGKGAGRKEKPNWEEKRTNHAIQYTLTQLQQSRRHTRTHILNRHILFSSPCAVVCSWSISHSTHPCSLFSSQPPNRIQTSANSSLTQLLYDTPFTTHI